MDFSENDLSSVLPGQLILPLSSIDEVSYSTNRNSSVGASMPTGSRSGTTALKRTVQNLPYLCVEAICKFTPTTNLIRLYSNAVPLSDPCWRVGMETTLRDRVRLPLSLGDDPAYHQTASLALFDAKGAKVASVKQPESLHFSSFGEFVEIAALSSRYMKLDGPRQMQQLFVANGYLLSCLPQLTDLTLVMMHDSRDFPGPLREGVTTRLLEPSLAARLLPQLRSLSIMSAEIDDEQSRDRISRDCAGVIPISEMAALQRLALSNFLFGGVMTQASNDSRTRLVLSRLTALVVLQEGRYFHNIDRFIAAHCKQLSFLSLLVAGQFRAYLAAFRALTGLSTLGVQLMESIRFDGLTFSDEEKIRSVTDLRFVCDPASNLVFQIASFFPKAKELSFQSDCNSPDALCLASSFCSAYVLPNLTALSCFHLSGFASPSSGETVTTQFIGNPNLPETVDLSPMIFENLIQDPSLLTAIFQAMKRNWIKSLLLRGPMHREALPRLKGHIDLSGASVKVSSWKDRDLDEQPGVFSVEELSEQTDFKIVGIKTSGGLKGEEFSIRVFHQLAKRRSIFE